jgi:hypothetical protein
METSFRGRKNHTTQNVMAAVDFDLKFTFVLAGWEGTAHDALVLRDALERENGLRVPQGKNKICSSILLIMAYNPVRIVICLCPSYARQILPC